MRNLGLVVALFVAGCHGNPDKSQVAADFAVLHPDCVLNDVTPWDGDEENADVLVRFHCNVAADKQEDVLHYRWQNGSWLLNHPGGTAGQVDFEAWVARHTTPDETVVCKKQIGADHYFVARRGSKFKTGSLLEVTGNGPEPRSFLIGWRFEDDQQRSLDTSKQPDALAGSYISAGNKVYAERVGLRSLATDNVKVMSIGVQVNKYSTDAAPPPDLQDATATQLCKVAL